MQTHMALTRGYNKMGHPSMLAAYATPLHSWQESEEPGEKLWRLFIKKVLPTQASQLTLPFSSPGGYLLSFSPGMDYIAAGLGGQRLVLWNAVTKQVLPPLDIPGLADYAFLPDFSQGKASVRLVIAGAGGLTIATFLEQEGLWNSVLLTSDRPLYRVAVHTTSHQVATVDATEKHLSVWALSALLASQKRQLSANKQALLCVHPTTIQRSLFSGVLTLHSAHRSGVLQSLALPDYSVFPEPPFAFSADGLRLACRGERSLLLWERETILSPFSEPRQAQGNGILFGGSDALCFTHEGNPAILTVLGEFHVFDWVSGEHSHRIHLATIKEPAEKRL